MGTKNRHYLERVKCVNEIYIEFHKKGYSNEFIYKNHIEKRFYISRSTFYNYLTIPYKMLSNMIFYFHFVVLIIYSKYYFIIYKNSVLFNFF